jgi:hypothetical protein
LAYAIGATGTVTRDSIYLDVLAAILVAYADSVWQAHYEAELDKMIHSFRIGRRPIFARARDRSMHG